MDLTHQFLFVGCSSTCTPVAMEAWNFDLDRNGVDVWEDLETWCIRGDTLFVSFSTKGQPCFFGDQVARIELKIGRTSTLGVSE